MSWPLRPGDNILTASPGPSVAMEGVQQRRVAQQPAPNSECFQEMEKKHSNFNNPFTGPTGLGRTGGWITAHKTCLQESQKNKRAPNVIIGSLGTKGDPLLKPTTMFLSTTIPLRSWSTQQLGLVRVWAAGSVRKETASNSKWSCWRSTICWICENIFVLLQCFSHLCVHQVTSK